MKKLFFFAAALFAAVTVNAASVIDFSTLLLESDWVVTGFKTNATETKSGKFVYDLDQDVVGAVTFPSYPQIRYDKAAPTSNKTKFFTVNTGKYVEAGGAGFEITITGVTVGDKVRLLVCNKSDKGAGSLEGTAGLLGDPVALPARDKNAGDEDDSTPRDKDGYYWLTAEFTALASTIKIAENVYGFRVQKIELGAGTGIDDVNADAKAVKTLDENGQIVILKGNKRYNALGAEL